MMGADLRNLDPKYKALMKHEDLLRIDQDEECRPPRLVRRGPVTVPNPEPKAGEFPWKQIPDASFTFFRHLSDGEFALSFVNLGPSEAEIHCEMVDLGLPITSGYGLELKDVFTGENLGIKKDTIQANVAGHDMKL